MKKLERSEFDEQWKGALEEAEVSPSTSVWSNLDHELTVAEGKENKKQVLFYQRLAAACVLFAFMAGSFGVYHWQQNTEQIAQLNSRGALNQKNNADAQPQANETTPNKNLNEKDVFSTSDGSDFNNGIRKERDVRNSESSTGGSKNGIDISREKKLSQGSKENFQAINKSENTVDKNSIALPDDNSQKTDNQVAVAKIESEKRNKEIEWISSNGDNELTLLPQGSLHGSPVFKDIIRMLPAMPSVFMAQSKRHDIKHEKLWASAVASAGTYINNAGSPYTVSSSQTSPSGSTYSMGMIGGARIAKRWVLQSGVQYLNQTAGYSSDIASNNLATVSNQASHPSQTPVHAFASVNSPAYDINSVNQFVTLPVQAGYLLVDKRIGWQINSGVATDFFVRNTLTDPSGQRQSYSQGPGADSPYRSVNFSGLMSSEVSYKLGSSYRISLVPGFKYALNPALKSQAGNSVVWDVGFRFRYIIK